MTIRSIYIAFAVAGMLSCIAVMPQQNNHCYALLRCHNKTIQTRNKTILLQCIASIALHLTSSSPSPSSHVYSDRQTFGEATTVGAAAMPAVSAAPSY